MIQVGDTKLIQNPISIGQASRKSESAGKDTLQRLQGYPNFKNYSTTRRLLDYKETTRIPKLSEIIEIVIKT